MPLFEVKGEDLVPFRSVRGGADLYEREIEDLLWANLEEFTGEALFPVARQPRLVGGGVPDVVALDESGQVVVIEVKRDIDRSQLAQCLEYAGWARTTNLDELASIYRRGPSQFISDWQDFTDTPTPKFVAPSPRLLLVARDFDPRTRSAIDFLQENGLPLTVIPVLVYEDEETRRFLDVGADYEPALPPVALGGDQEARATYLYKGRNVIMLDLLDAGMILPGEQMVWERPRLGQTYRAEVLASGEIKLENGTVHKSPSLAAIKAADVVSYDGWHAWRLPRLDGIQLDELRQRLIATEVAPAIAPADGSQ